MKTHQNNFHKEALHDLTTKFVKFTNEGYIPEEYRTLLDYFKMHYKNSNKGIKGRGKARKIAGKEAQSTPRKATKPTASTSRKAPQRPQEPIYTMANGPGAMDGSVPRSAPAAFAPGFPVVDQGPNATQMFYDEGQASHMTFTERFY